MPAWDDPLPERARARLGEAPHVRAALAALVAELPPPLARLLLAHVARRLDDGLTPAAAVQAAVGALAALGRGLR